MAWGLLISGAMNLCTCGSELIPGIMPGSKGWCKDECDLKTNPVNALQSDVQMYHVSRTIDDGYYCKPGGSMSMCLFAEDDTAPMWVQGKHSVVEERNNAHTIIPVETVKLRRYYYMPESDLFCMGRLWQVFSVPGPKLVRVRFDADYIGDCDGLMARLVCNTGSMEPIRA